MMIRGSIAAILLLLADQTRAFAPSNRRTTPARRLAAASNEVATVATVTSESSASKFSGAGPIQVDMNQYNLDDLERIAEEWTAVVLPATPMQAEGVYLAAQSKQELMVDTVEVQLPRRVGQGLGIELLELAGGREDGLGITIVSGLVEGGCADGSGILPGDSISQVEVVSCTTDSSVTNGDNGLVEETTQEQNFAVATECLGYDKTIDAIVSLPPPTGDASEKVVLTLKRLRRKPKVKINFQYPPEMEEEDISIELFAGENLRRSMLVKGLKLNDPLALRFDSGGLGDCGADGTCGTCTVNIVKGGDLVNPPSRLESQAFQKETRWRMSCKTIVGYGMQEGEMTVRLSPRQWKS